MGRAAGNTDNLSDRLKTEPAPNMGCDDFALFGRQRRHGPRDLVCVDPLGIGYLEPLASVLRRFVFSPPPSPHGPDGHKRLVAGGAKQPWQGISRRAGLLGQFHKGLLHGRFGIVAQLPCVQHERRRVRVEQPTDQCGLDHVTRVFVALVHYP